MDFLLESWTKRIRRHRKILVLTFKVQARALPQCILIVRFMYSSKWVTLILRTSIVWVKRHVSSDLSFVSSLSWSAKIGGGLQEWTAHLDAQSLQSGLHYMLCVDLDGVPLVALDYLHCRTIFNTPYPPSPWNPTSSFRSLFDTLTGIFPKDNVTLPSGPTGFDVFASPVVASWQNISIRIWTSFEWQKPESLNMLNHLIFLSSFTIDLLQFDRNFRRAKGYQHPTNDVFRAAAAQQIRPMYRNPYEARRKLLSFVSMQKYVLWCVMFLSIQLKSYKYHHQTTEHSCNWNVPSLCSFEEAYMCCGL